MNAVKIEIVAVVEIEIGDLPVVIEAGILPEIAIVTIEIVAIHTNAFQQIEVQMETVIPTEIDDHRLQINGDLSAIVVLTNKTVADVHPDLIVTLTGMTGLDKPTKIGVNGRQVFHAVCLVDLEEGSSSSLQISLASVAEILRILITRLGLKQLQEIRKEQNKVAQTLTIDQ